MMLDIYINIFNSYTHIISKFSVRTITSHSVRLHPLLGKLRHGTNLFSHLIKLAMTTDCIVT